MILDLDIGNSRSKWRIVDRSGQFVAAGTAVDVDELLAATAASHPLRRVRISCVRGGGFLERLAGRLADRWQLQVDIARVARHCQGVTVNYADLSRLGVDRWLAMLAAYRAVGGATLVVDCGTALTVDLLAADGSHQGGYIVPGLRLAATALTEHTGIRLTGEPDWALDPGHSTEQAVYHGILVTIVALLEKIVRSRPEALSGKRAPILFLTGGDADLLARQLSEPKVEVRVVPDLVFAGLALALP